MTISSSKSGFDFFKNLLCRNDGIRRGGDRSPDHQIICPGRDGLGRCRGAFLIMFVASRGANSRNDQLHVSINLFSQRSNLARAGDNSADPTLRPDFRQSYDLL